MTSGRVTKWNLLASRKTSRSSPGLSGSKMFWVTTWIRRTLGAGSVSFLEEACWARAGPPWIAARVASAAISGRKGRA